MLLGLRRIEQYPAALSQGQAARDNSTCHQHLATRTTLIRWVRYFSIPPHTTCYHLLHPTSRATGGVVVVAVVVVVLDGGGSDGGGDGLVECSFGVALRVERNYTTRKHTKDRLTFVK